MVSIRDLDENLSKGSVWEVKAFRRGDENGQDLNVEIIGKGIDSNDYLIYLCEISYA